MSTGHYRIIPFRSAIPPVGIFMGGPLIVPELPKFSRGVRVTDDCVYTVTSQLSGAVTLSLDTETTGLYPYKNDKMFSMIIHDSEHSYYFNYKDYGDGTPFLTSDSTRYITPLFKQPHNWVLFNAKFDIAFIRKHFSLGKHWSLPGAIDLKTLCRLENNTHMSYTLGECAKRFDLEKDDRVEEYIKEHSLYTMLDIPGKSVRQRIPHFDKVPAQLIFEYGCKDAEITFKLGKKVLEKLVEIDQDEKINTVHLNEKELLRHIARMEATGIKINRSFVADAVLSEVAREAKSKNQFKTITGKDYMASPKLFAEIFESDKVRWKYTDKNNPSFDSDTLKTFTNPAAMLVLAARDAKSKMDFYNGFIYYADANDIVHPNLDPAGTATGRFSSSNPNFQNLTNEEHEVEDGFLIRRAIVPRSSSNILVSVDYSQQEYRLMLDYAGELPLIDAIMGGADVHQATADMMGVSRREAKTLNFMLLYGGGAQKLADALGIELEAAKDLKRLYFSRLPRVQRFIESATQTARERGYVFNWLGRRLHFPNPEFAYKAANAIIQGGGADIMKVAINKVYTYLYDNNLIDSIYPILTVHDELILEGDKTLVIKHIEEIRSTMEKAYPHRNIPMACSIAWSAKSLAEPDMIAGIPT